MQTTYADDLAVLTELVDAGNDLDGVKMHLYTAGPSLSGGMVVGDFTEATFTGSAAKAVTWGAPYYGPDGVPQVDTQLLSFIATADPASPETVLGYYLTDTAGTRLLAADLFETPGVIAKSGDGKSFALAYRRFDGILVEV